MNPGELVAKLEPSACSLDPRVDGWRLPEISAEDIAGALGMIRGESGPALLAHAKYGLEARSARKLLARIKGAALTQWAPIEINLLHAFGMMILESAILPQLCMTCNGRKEVIVRDLRIVCKHCEGSGIGRRTDLSMASALSVSKGEWKGKWERRYVKMMDLVGAWDYEARRAILDNVL